MYEGRIEEGGVRGRSSVKWINRVDEFGREVTRQEMECAEREN